LSRSTFYDLFPVTSLLGILLVTFFVLEFLADQKVGVEFNLDQSLPLFWIGPQALTLLGDMDPGLIQEGEVWRLLSCAFLHANVVHLLFSLWVLVELGRFCEQLISGPKMFPIYLLCGLGSSLASMATSLLGDYHTSVGAAGALSGLIGLVLVYAIRQRHPDLRDTIVRWVIYIVLLSLLMPRVDHAGHAGGFVTGALLGLSVKDYITSTSARRWFYPAYAAGAVLALSLCLAVWDYFSGIFLRR
jgi:membrane associated rhomboid family serine protease